MMIETTSCKITSAKIPSDKMTSFKISNTKRNGLQNFSVKMTDSDNDTGAQVSGFFSCDTTCTCTLNANLTKNSCYRCTLFFVFCVKTPFNTISILWNNVIWVFFLFHTAYLFKFHDTIIYHEKYHNACLLGIKSTQYPNTCYAKDEVEVFQVTLAMSLFLGMNPIICSCRKRITNMAFMSSILKYRKIRSLV